MLSRRALHRTPTLILFACALAANIAWPRSAWDAFPADQKRSLEQEARLIVNLVQNHHESGRLFAQIDAREVLNRYMDELDQGRLYLTPDDIQYVQQRFARTLKSVYLIKGDLLPAFEIFDLFTERVVARTEWIEKQLGNELSLEGDEQLPLEKSDGSSPSDASSDRLWLLRLKDELISETLNGRAGPAAAAALAEQYARFRRQIQTVDPLAIRERFLDGLLRSFDPHSGYFSADSAKEFAVEMNSTTSGAGLVLKKEKGLCVIEALEPGGPAELQEELRPEDILEAFSEGNGPWIELRGRRLREIVSMIRGAEGTQFRLAARTPGVNARREVTLRRATIVSIDDRARGAVCEVKDVGNKPQTIGWIELPSFYDTPQDPKAPTATSDVAALLEEMAQRNIGGLVLDLRRNGGGALTEALGLAGLFLPDSVVAVTFGIQGKRKELRATHGAAKFTGPLVVLISEQSASASEIFAAAMKYHQRAIIVGSAATFGKGSVQAYIDLAAGRDGKPQPDRGMWGTLRLTSERFFRPDGGAIQCDGVAADLVLPNQTVHGFQREAALPHALPAVPAPRGVNAPAPAPLPISVSKELLTSVQRQTAERISKMAEWTVWNREKEMERARLMPDSRPLNLAKRLEQSQSTEKQSYALTLERRRLTEHESYATHPLEVSDVAAAIASHRAALAAQKVPSGESAIGRLHLGAFIFRTDKDQPRRLWISSFRFRAFLDDAEQLASAYALASGRSYTAAQMRAAFCAADLVQDHSDENFLACFGAASAIDGAALASRLRGVEAVLAAIVQLEPSLRMHRHGLDVPLREALRVTADWANALPPPSEPYFLSSASTKP